MSIEIGNLSPEHNIEHIHELSATSIASMYTRFKVRSGSERKLGALYKKFAEELHLAEEFDYHFPEMYWAHELGVMCAIREDLLGIFVDESISKGTKQVVILAAGINPFAAHLADTYPEVKIVATDLPGVTSVVRSKTREILGKIPENLVYQDLNVLDEETMHRFDQELIADQPTSIICEGLLPYFNGTQMEQFANNVKPWLTKMHNTLGCDLATQEGINNTIFQLRQSKKLLRRLYQVARVPVGSLAFRNGTEVKNFWEKHSLQITTRQIPRSEELKEEEKRDFYIGFLKENDFSFPGCFDVYNQVGKVAAKTRIYQVSSK